MRICTAVLEFLCFSNLVDFFFFILQGILPWEQHNLASMLSLNRRENPSLSVSSPGTKEQVYSYKESPTACGAATISRSKCNISGAYEWVHMAKTVRYLQMMKT